MRALIGHTGFVGSHLDGPGFQARFNSRNIEEARGRRFSEVVCAGIQAVKWWANQNPEADWAGIKKLLEVLEEVEADRFTLISTVDVYKSPLGVTEASPIVTEGLHSYGLHRYRAEEFVRRRYGDAACVIRLPGLFGKGLKKNLIFDLLSGGDTSGFAADSTFQFYGLGRLSADLETVARSGLGLINLAVEPVRVDDAAEAVTGRGHQGSPGAPVVRYDMQTRHADLWGQDGPYLEDRAACLARISAFARDWAA
ncbi:NAD-dependent epimerase/dehydratase family protein (plasmid) [Roseobacteraceae bacterium NS-SX3]